jgi:hypothetical protein
MAALQRFEHAKINAAVAKFKATNWQMEKGAWFMKNEDFACWRQQVHVNMTEPRLSTVCAYMHNKHEWKQT